MGTAVAAKVFGGKNASTTSGVRSCVSASYVYFGRGIADPSDVVDAHDDRFFLSQGWS
jgi:hypothetical protein